MKHKTCCLVTAALLHLAGCAASPQLANPAAATPEVQVNAPAWRVGSQWQYSDGYGLRVARVDGPVVSFQRTDDPAQFFSRRGFLREDSQSATTTRKLLFEDAPPYAGLQLNPRSPLVYRRDYDAGGRSMSHVTSWTVEHRDHVVVPAGEFDCVILVMRTRSLTSNWTGYERWWFSPLVQNYVRLEYQYGPQPAAARVLMSYSLAREPSGATSGNPARNGSTPAMAQVQAPSK